MRVTKRLATAALLTGTPVACAQIVDAGFDGVSFDRPDAAVEPEGSDDSTGFGGTAGTPDSSVGGDSGSAPNTAPEARDGTLVVVQGARKQSRLPSFDADGDPRWHELDIPPALGSVIIDSVTGDFEYVSRSDKYGADSFTYQVSSDGKVWTKAVGTIKVTVVARGPLPAEAGVVPLPAHGYWTGSGLDIEDDTAAVAAIENPFSLIYVIRRDTTGRWKLRQRIDGDPNNGDPHPGRIFGNDIALSGDWMAVTGWGNSVGVRGAVYFYKRPRHDADYVLAQRIDSGSVDDSFGWEVALEGDLAVVGADRRANSFVDGGFEHRTIGAAYVFRRFGDQWREEQKISAPATPSRATEEGFGHSLGIANGALVTRTVASGSDVGGAVYVFSQQSGGWTLESRFDAVPPLPYSAGFGEHIAAHGDKALVACSQQPNCVYSYAREGPEWVARGLVTPPTGVEELRGLGSILALHDNTAIIVGFGSSAAAPGYAYIYHYDRTVTGSAGSGWLYSGQQLTGMALEANGIGDRVAFDGTTVVMTAIESIESGQRSAVYFYGIEPPGNN